MGMRNFSKVWTLIQTFAWGTLWLSTSVFAHEGDLHQSVVADNCVAAASAWIDSLDAEQTQLAVSPFDEAKRRDWHYLNNLPPIYMRKEGLVFKQMNSAQRILGHELIRCGLSSQGYQKTTGIMILESIGWGQLPDKGIEVAKRISDTVGTMDAYWLAVFGDPASGEPWQWQLEGHHVALNFTFADNGISVTPTFLGTRPNVILEGEFAGWHAMGYEKTRAFALLASLTPEQLKTAVISDVVANNIFTDPERLEVFDAYAGLPASEMTLEQQALLWRIINEYVLNYEYEISADRIAEIKQDGIENIHFAWMGETDSERKPIYFRVHGPSVVIEFANASNLGGNKAPKLNADGTLKRGKHDIADPNHIHSIYLNPKRYFGRDLLREHYLESHDTTDPSDAAASQ
jgi:hypothetical protein